MYKMERKQGTFERGDSGVGRIRFSTDKKNVQVIVNVAIGNPKDENFEQHSYTLSIDDCPDNILLARNAKEWMLQMSSDGKKLLSFRPVKGSFVVKTKEFAAKEGEEPAPKVKEVSFQKAGKTVEYHYEYFTVILEIDEPKEYKGLTIPLVLRYQFAEFVHDSKSVIGFSMGGKYTDALEEYMLVAGILSDTYYPMEYKDNILPTLQRIALHEDRKFQITVKDGWIVPGSLMEIDNPDETDIPFDVDDANTAVTITPTPVFNTTQSEEMDFEPDESN